MSKTNTITRKRKILIVDDSEMNRALLSDILYGQYEVLEAENGKEAAAILHEREPEIALVLLDIVMPVMDGFELLTLMNEKGWMRHIPVIMISAENSPTSVDRAYDLGVLDYINRPFDERTVRHRVNSAIMVSAKQNELVNMVMDQIYEKEKDNQMMIEILSNLVEFRNGESGLHVMHIRILTEIFLKKLINKTDQYSITRQDIPLICNASALHDIGKLTIPDEILNKPGKLTNEEFAVMKTHSMEGAKLLENLPMSGEEPLVQISYQICRWHHERYDGRGYPDGLKGDEIPIVAQIVALADVYDALTSKRVYKDAYSHEKAVDMILHGECGTFNPILMECLDEIAGTLEKQLREISNKDQTELEIIRSVDQILEQGGNNISDRSLRLLEHEREKYKFFADQTPEIQFDYTVVPEIINLSKYGAEQLGLPEKVLNSKEGLIEKGIFTVEDLHDLSESLRNTTPQDPMIEKEYQLTIQGKTSTYKIIAKSMWSIGGPEEYEGAVGKIVKV